MQMLVLVLVQVLVLTEDGVWWWWCSAVPNVRPFLGSRPPRASSSPLHAERSPHFLSLDPTATHPPNPINTPVWQPTAAARPCRRVIEVVAVIPQLRPRQRNRTLPTCHLLSVPPDTLLPFFVPRQ